MRDQCLEKAGTEGTVVVQQWPRRVAEARLIGDDAAAGLEMMGESSQFVPVETVLSAGSIRIGSAPAGPDTSYPTGMGVPCQVQANVID